MINASAAQGSIALLRRRARIPLPSLCFDLLGVFPIMLPLEVLPEIAVLNGAVSQNGGQDKKRFQDPIPAMRTFGKKNKLRRVSPNAGRHCWLVQQCHVWPDVTLERRPLRCRFGREPPRVPKGHSTASTRTDDSRGVTTV